MIDAALRALARRTDVDEFVVREVRRARGRLARDQQGLRHATEIEHTLHATIYRDFREGRGEASFELSGDDRALIGEAIRGASQRAARALGPRWSLPAAAAPARVDLLDAELAGSELEDYPAVLADLAANAAAAERLSWSWLEVVVERAQIEVAVSTGLRLEFPEGLLVLRGAVVDSSSTGEAEEPVELHARRLADLPIASALAGARHRLGLRATAQPFAPDIDATSGAEAPTPAAGTAMQPGRLVDLVVSPEVIVGPTEGGQHGWLSGVVELAGEAQLALGITRFRPGEPLVGLETPGSSRAGRFEPPGRFATPGSSHSSRFTLISDGALPFGIRSAPCGELGDPVRRFALVTGGSAGERGLSARGAALYGGNANGGVRNLSLVAGMETTAALLTPGDRPLVRAHRGAWSELQSRTGALAARLALSEVVVGGETQSVLGGHLWFDSVQAWLGARLSAERAQLSWYQGPSLVRFDGLRLS